MNGHAALIAARHATRLLISTMMFAAQVHGATQTSIVGGPGGTAFTDRPASADARIAEVRIRAGSWVDSVQLLYQFPDGRRSVSRRHGGDGGSPHVFVLEPDEQIVGISGRQGQYVESIQIHTNKRTSPIYGGTGGVPFRIAAPPGHTVIGFVGRAGAYLDAVGLALSPKPSPAPRPIGKAPGRIEEERAEAERRMAQAEAQARARNDKARPPAPVQIEKPASKPKPASLPDFPWPPPLPSARLVMPDSLFRSPASPEPTLSAVGARLTAALAEATYNEYSYYRVPNGFALVARLERISAEGTPMPEEFRFLQPGSQEPFSFASYIRQLFFAPEGFYRQIVFVVTDQPFAATGNKLDPAAAAKLLSHGVDRLSGDYDIAPFTAAHRVSALIYEFSKGPRERDVSMLTPGRLGARMHLDRAGIYPALSRRP